MARPGAPRLLILVGLAIVIAINAMLFGGRLTAWVADSTGTALAPVSGALSRVRALLATAAGRSDLAAQNLALTSEIVRLQSQLANEDGLRRDVAFYRDAAGIRDRTGAEPIRAGVFSYPQAGGVRQVVLNKGRADWIDVGDIVVTPTGALIGAVSRLFEHHSVVSTVGDVALEVTVRIVGSDVAGLLRTSADGSVIVDLVQKNESVSEGAIIATSGDDWYPAGLVVGTVRSVDNDAATLFKIVRVTPASLGVASGDVIVIRP